jgi:hypothetical protein
MLKKVVNGTWWDPLILGVASGYSNCILGELRRRHDISRRWDSHRTRSINSFQITMIEAVQIEMKS